MCCLSAQMSDIGTVVAKVFKSLGRCVLPGAWASARASHTSRPPSCRAVAEHRPHERQTAPGTEGFEQGCREGPAQSVILRLFHWRGVEVPDTVRERVRAGRDLGALERLTALAADLMGRSGGMSAEGWVRRG